MNDASRVKFLRVALIVVGLIFLLGVYPLTILWPSGWAWHHAGQSMYLQMILGIYATLGVFLLLASRDPLANRTLIWFTVWSSAVHGESWRHSRLHIRNTTDIFWETCPRC